MNDLSTRLTKCFSEVFPDLKENEISQATPRSIQKWDSIATINLLTIIEEEFGVSFGPEELEKLTSYRSILEYLERKDGPSSSQRD
jgi:acyl carrier protein